MKDYKNINTSHDDDLDMTTIVVSVGLFACFVCFLLIGGVWQ